MPFNLSFLLALCNGRQLAAPYFAAASEEVSAFSEVAPFSLVAASFPVAVSSFLDSTVVPEEVFAPSEDVEAGVEPQAAKEKIIMAVNTLASTFFIVKSPLCYQHE